MRGWFRCDTFGGVFCVERRSSRGLLVAGMTAVCGLVGCMRMKPSRIGPVTAELMRHNRGRPPALIEEWGAKAKRPGDAVLLWAGAVRRWDGALLGWSALSAHLARRDSSVSLGDIPAAKVERLLAPLAHRGRIGIMQALLRGPVGPSELSEVTGLHGGGLYHHLRELQHSAYVRQDEGRYHLTQLGGQLLAMVLCVANDVVADRPEEGVAAGESWEQPQA